MSKKPKPCKPKPKEDWEKLKQAMIASFTRANDPFRIDATFFANPAQVLTPVHIK